MAAKELDTTRNAVPFDKANIPGPKMAKAVKAVVAGKFISKAKRPLLIVGTAAGDDGVIEIVRSMSEKGIPVHQPTDEHSCYSSLARTSLPSNCYNFQGAASGKLFLAAKYDLVD